MQSEDDESEQSTNDVTNLTTTFNLNFLKGVKNSSKTKSLNFPYKIPSNINSQFLKTFTAFNEHYKIPITHRNVM